MFFECLSGKQQQLLLRAGWKTKNPTPMLERLPELEGYPFYFQITMTSYGADLEPGVPGKNDVVIPSFQRLSRTIGPERVIWRYDPILLSDHYTAL